MDISISNVKSFNILYPKINIYNNTYPYQINKKDIIMKTKDVFLEELKNPYDFCNRWIFSWNEPNYCVFIIIN